MLLIAMPGFLLLIGIEALWGWYKHGEKQPLVDTIASLTSGMTNILKSTLGLTIVLVTYDWLLPRLQLVTWDKGSAWPYIITFVFIDFTGYWLHRIQHKINILWGHHVVHHSSEEFNLPCALRQQIAVLTNIYVVATIPLAIMGIQPAVLGLIGPIHLFAQFWYHTRYIGKLGFLEYIIVTPSAHRVHHAMNDAYMDKNFSQIFIIWDRIFGTYQDELEAEPCVYGMRRPAQSWNPYIINFKHQYSLLKDAWHTRSIKDKLRIWFMPTGWRPADVVDAHPLFTIYRMDELTKYAPTYSSSFRAFSLVHLTVLFSLLCFLFFRFGEIDTQQALLNGIILLVTIFAFTAFLDKKLYGALSMVIACSGMAAYALVQADWFGLNSFVPNGSYAIAIYYSLAAVISLRFWFAELRHPASPVIA